MTELFNLKVNLNKVSKAVKQFVADVAKTEGNKKRIDTDEEYNKLSMYLSGAAQGMNKDEIGYVQGFIFEYQNRKAQEFEETFVTDNTKKEVSKIAKRMGDKKTIDTDEEAQALATMLRNTHNDLNQADIIYIENLLLNSGYANYLPKPEEPPVQVVNVTINEIYVEENGNKNDGSGEETDCKETLPQKDYIPKSKKTAPHRQSRPVTPVPQKKVPEKKNENAAKPVIAEKDRNKGFGLADRVVHELNSHIANNSVIKEALSEVNDKNAYSFIGKFISAAQQGVNEGVFSVSDLFNKLNYNDTLHVMRKLLSQAKSIGLEKTSAYNSLKAEITYAERYLDENPSADPTDVTISKADNAIQRLYSEMSKVYE